MTATERLEHMIAQLGLGIDKCDRHIKAYTPNTGVHKMLSGTRHELQNILIEIHKGNVK